MKAKLDQISEKVDRKSKSEPREDLEDDQNKYYEISTHRVMQELEADQVTIEENPVDVVNRKKMELRAWNVRDMPLQYNESEETAFEKQLKATETSSTIKDNGRAQQTQLEDQSKKLDGKDGICSGE